MYFSFYKTVLIYFAKAQSAVAIENEDKKASCDVLYKLVRELSIAPDSIFYPEKPPKDSEAENLIRML